MRSLVLIGLIVWASIGFGKAFEFDHFGPRLDAAYRLQLEAFFPSDRLSLKELQSLSAAAMSYEQFLQKLQLRRPQLFEHYVLLHESGSLQFADRQHPRVLLFADGLILAFAEHPRQGERRVEAIELDPSSWRFQFAELRFPKEGDSSFQSNPHVCQSCHGQDQHPLWEPYDFWPNAYGSNIARFASASEKSAYESLRLQPEKQGVYAHLSWYTPPPKNDVALEGLEAFTEYVTQLHTFGTLQRWRTRYPELKALTPVILAALQNCAQGEDDQHIAVQFRRFLPETWRDEFEAAYPVLHASIQAARSQFKAYQTERYQRLFPTDPEAFLFPLQVDRLADETATIALMTWVLRKFGLDPEELSLTQGQNPYVRSVPSDSAFDLATTWALVDPAFYQRLKPERQMAGGYAYTWVRFRCDELEQESQRFQGQSLSQGRLVPTSPKQAPTVFGECISCHSYGRKAPPIPFDRTEALRAYLKREGTRANVEARLRSHDARQMPPYRALSPVELEDFHQILESLR